MSFYYGTHCPKIGAIVHIRNSLCRAFLNLLTDFVVMLISYQVSFLWKTVCTMSRVKNNYSLIIWAIYFTIGGLNLQFLVFSKLKM